jgi:integrase
MDSKSRARRARGDGGYRKRGKDTWELKFSVVDGKTGHRKTRYQTFKGNETAARAKLRDLVKLAGDGGSVAPARQIFGDVLDSWDGALAVSPKTAERYRELVRLYVRPHLGSARLATLRPSRIESFYGDLRDGRNPSGAVVQRKLSARTIGHIHRLVVQALSVAERDGLIPSNPARNAKRPKIERGEIEILNESEVRDVLRKLQGRSFYRIAALGLSTGMRRGELLGLRWKDVELDAAMLRVEQSIEQTKAGGLRAKGPKTRYSKRAISLPASIVTELRTLRREQQEERLRLGLGREPDDALVFRRTDPSTGTLGPLLPNSVTTEWRRLVRMLKLPKVSLHAWRHTHASQLIDSGMDVLTISRRLGHGSPSITLDVYGHRFKRKDEGAAAVFEAAFSGVFTETDADKAGTPAKAISGRSVAKPAGLQ